MSPLSVFDAIYIINLASRDDRRREMAGQLARVGLSFEDPQVHLFSAVRPDDAAGFESIGARGCFMSHLGVLRAARSRHNVLILEDDLNFSADCKMPALPDDWGIFYGSARHALQATSALTQASPHDGIGCSHFVAFNGPQIEPAIAFLESILSRPAGHPLGGPMHIDGAYAVFRKNNPRVVTLLATPELGFQRSSRSDIFPLRWFDRTPLVRYLVQAIRRVVRH